MSTIGWTKNKKRKPRLSESKVDVCIVGGGIVGQMTALELALSGKKVHLIDKVYIGSSRHNIGEAIDQNIESQTLPFIRYSHEMWQNTAEQYGQDLGFEICGSATFATSELESDILKKRVESDKTNGLVTQFIDTSAALATLLGVNELPAEVCSARYAPKDAAIDTSRALDNLRVLLIRHGVKIWSSDEVEEILFDGDRVIGVRAANEKIYAEHTVLSAGVWTTKLINQIGLHAPVRPARAHLIEVSPFRKFPNQVLAYNTPTGDIIMKRLRTGRVLITYTGVSDQAQATYSTQPDYDAVRSVLQQCTKLIEGLRYAPVQKLTVISLAVTPDNNPYVGPVSKHPGLILAIGFNGKSYAFAAGVGKFIRSVVTGEKFPIDMSSLSPDRVHSAAQKIEEQHMDAMPDVAEEVVETEENDEAADGTTVEKAQEMLDGEREGGDWESEVIEKGEHDATMADAPDVVQAEKQKTDWDTDAEVLDQDVTMAEAPEVLQANKEGGDWEDNVERANNDVKMADAPEVLQANKEGGDWEDNVERANNAVKMADEPEVLQANKEGGDWERDAKGNNPEADMSYSQQEKEQYEAVDTAAEKPLPQDEFQAVDTAAEKSLDQPNPEAGTVDTAAEKPLPQDEFQAVDTAAEKSLDQPNPEAGTVDTAAEKPLPQDEFPAVDTAAEKSLEQPNPEAGAVDTAAESRGPRKGTVIEDEEAYKAEAEKLASMGSSWGREKVSAEEQEKKREEAQQKLKEAQERAKLEEEKRRVDAQHKFAMAQEKSKLEQQKREQEEQKKREEMRIKAEKRLEETNS